VILAKERVGDETVSLPRPIVSPKLDRGHAGLVVIQGREIGRLYRLRRRESVLGREEAADLRVLDDRISRRHARLSVAREGDGGALRVFLSDLGSTNGTTVNGEQVARTELREGDKLQLGDTVLKFVLQDDLDARFHQEIRNRIAFDQLTGLLTKESLMTAAEDELKRCARFSLPMAVLMMDLDRFKNVNDTHGHLTGSSVLAEVGRLMRLGFRSTDVSARYGGEEFVAYLAEIGADSAASAAERIRAAIEGHPFRRADDSAGDSVQDSAQVLRVTISIGVSEFPKDGATLVSLIAAADRALYRAKETGRNRVCLA
jgi:diguanylate cyclase (GGDEF)-like protein